jgi:hypothetical protein
MLRAFIKYLNISELDEPTPRGFTLLETLFHADNSEGLLALVKKGYKAQASFLDIPLIQGHSLLFRVLNEKKEDLLKQILPYTSYLDIIAFRNELDNVSNYSFDLDLFVLLLKRAQEQLGARKNLQARTSLAKLLRLDDITFLTWYSAHDPSPAMIARNYPFQSFNLLPFSLSHAYCRFGASFFYDLSLSKESSNSNQLPVKVKEPLINRAIKISRPELVTYFLQELGMSPNVYSHTLDVPNSTPKTPLMLSALSARNQTDLIDLLLEHGGNLLVTDGHYTAADYLCMRGGPYIHPYNPLYSLYPRYMDLAMWGAMLVFHCTLPLLYSNFLISIIRSVATLFNFIHTLSVYSTLYIGPFSSDFLPFSIFMVDSIKLYLDALLVFLPSIWLTYKGVLSLKHSFRQAKEGLFYALDESLKTKSLEELDAIEKEIKEFEKVAQISSEAQQRFLLKLEQDEKNLMTSSLTNEERTSLETRKQLRPILQKTISYSSSKRVALKRMITTLLEKTNARKKHLLQKNNAIQALATPNAALTLRTNPSTSKKAKRIIPKVEMGTTPDFLRPVSTSSITPNTYSIENDLDELNKKRELLQELAEQNEKQQKELRRQLKNRLSQVDNPKAKIPASIKEIQSALKNMSPSLPDKMLQKDKIDAAIKHQQGLSSKLTTLKNELLSFTQLSSSATANTEINSRSTRHNPLITSVEMPVRQAIEPIATLPTDTNHIVTASSSVQEENILPREFGSEPTSIACSSHDAEQSTISRSSTSSSAEVYVLLQKSSEKDLYRGSKNNPSKKRQSPPETSSHSRSLSRQEQLGERYTAIIRNVANEHDQLFCLRGWALNMLLGLITKEGFFADTFSEKQYKMIVAMRNIVVHNLNDLTAEHIAEFYQVLIQSSLGALPTKLQQTMFFKEKQQTLNTPTDLSAKTILHYLFYYLQELSQYCKFKGQKLSPEAESKLRFLLINIGDFWKQVPDTEKRTLAKKVRPIIIKYLNSMIASRNQSAHEWTIEYSQQLLIKLPELEGIIQSLKRYLHIAEPAPEPEIAPSSSHQRFVP